MKRWWGGLERPRKIILIALALMTLSQFCDYSSGYSVQSSMPIGGGGGGDYVEPNLSTGLAVAHISTQVAGVSGWKQHPLAWLALGGLLLAFGTDRDLGLWWRRRGYWAGVVGLLFGFFPLDLTAPLGWGALLGLIALGLGVWAAQIHGRSLRVRAAAPAAG